MAENLTDDIVAMEFDLFDKVNNEGGRAACQDDFPTFQVMRGAQFDAWSEAMRASYLDDLAAAKRAGRNLLTEKYAYMTGYGYMGEADGYERKCELVAAIAAAMMQDTLRLRDSHPGVMGRSRPIVAGAEGEGESGAGGGVSIDVYLTCELMTYSVRTLGLMAARIEELHAKGTSLPLLIHENIARRYGFDSLDEMEERIRRART